MKPDIVRNLISCAVAFFVAGSALADTEVVDGIEWQYTLKNGYVTLNRCKTRLVEGHVNIPSCLGGKAVVSIGTGVFTGCHNMTSFAIPETVTSIGVGAFSDCISLKTVFIPKNVISIGNGAFQLCDNLESFSVAEENPSFSVANGLLCDKNITEVVSCPEMMNAVAIPQSVTTIRTHAFKGCHLITEIYISEQISRIGAGAFGECWNLSSYLVDEENANYRCIDGLLCNKLGTELVSCPGAMSNISIPGTVIFIGDEAFYGCVNLISVSMPSNIRCIGQHAFCGCSRLGSITFKEGLTSIEYGAFMDCPLLTDVVLPSTVSKIGDDVFFNCSVRVYYRSSLPPLCGDNIYDERSANISYVPTSWNLTEELWQGMPWEYWNPLADDNKEVVGTIVYVAGDKVGFDTGLVGYAAKGLPSGLKLNKKTGVISGTPKKPGTYDVTFTKKGEETVTMTFVVDPFPTISIAMEGDTEKCKVTGASKPGKGYSVGKKVNLAAKAPKGTAFVGWFMDGEPWPDEATHLAAKQKYVMTGESLSLVARFEREKMSVSCPGLSSPLAVGSAVSIPIAIETQSGVKSVKGSKLPSGLKVKKVGDGWAIVGTPKKAGTYNAKVKVTAKSGAVEEVVISVVVE